VLGLGGAMRMLSTILLSILKQFIMAKKNKKIVSQVSLTTIDQKICELHKIVQGNSNDIQIIKEEMAYGKGGVKVLVWIIGIVVTLIAAWNILPLKK
jgi:hypothetical protein